MSVCLVYLIFLELQCVDTTLILMVNEEILFPEPWATSIIHSALNFEVRHGNSILLSLCKLEISIIDSYLIRPCSKSCLIASDVPDDYCYSSLLGYRFSFNLVWNFQIHTHVYKPMTYLCINSNLRKIHILIECIKCQVIFSGFFNASCIFLIYM